MVAAQVAVRQHSFELEVGGALEVGLPARRQPLAHRLVDQRKDARLNLGVQRAVARAPLRRVAARHAAARGLLDGKAVQIGQKAA